MWTITLIYYLKMRSLSPTILEFIVDMIYVQKSYCNRLRETARLIPPGLEGADILVYTPEEFIEMKREGNALAEMIMEEGIIIYDRQTEN